MEKRFKVAGPGSTVIEWREAIDQDNGVRVDVPKESSQLIVTLFILKVICNLAENGK
jgi:hypothetical protein